MVQLDQLEASAEDDGSATAEPRYVDLQLAFWVSCWVVVISVAIVILHAMCRCITKVNQELCACPPG